MNWEVTGLFRTNQKKKGSEEGAGEAREEMR